MQGTVNRLEGLAEGAKKASRVLATVSTEKKNAGLEAIAAALETEAPAVLAANAVDMSNGRENGLSEALLDRLLLTRERLANVAADVRSVAALPDPVGVEIDRRTLPNGIVLIRRRVPLGVVAVIYEARPNVTVDVAALCLKSGNAVILRGGSESFHSNQALAGALQNVLAEVGLPADSVAFVDDPDWARVGELLRMDRYVNMVVPRGGSGLHELCRKQSTIPVMTGGIGICHLFVDETADLDRAVDIIENAKVQRPSVCNALDTMLVHAAVAERFLPRVADRLAESGVELRADPASFGLLEANGSGIDLFPAGPDDFDQEWLSLVLGVKVVDDLDDAMAHIREHSTEHSDGILTEDGANAERFVHEIDSAAVYVNASTRFTDGSVFGLGAEVAISTQRLHARGPMGLEELTTYKWIGLGSGQIRG